MAKVKVVTAYVDLNLTRRPSADFHALGNRLIDACWPNVRAFINFPFEKCWAVEAARECGADRAANSRAPDRFETDDEHLRSNLVQHSPLQWMKMAAAEDPSPDVFVWLGYSILKQGDFTGKRLREEHVVEFLDKVAQFVFDTLPYPAIRPDDPVTPFGDNWQVVGSTIVAPRQWLDALAWHYQLQMRLFFLKRRAVPLDLAIWPAVIRQSGLPFRPYRAEYDHTQLTNFPG